ncbi:hypothetical protein yaldo0001_33930 [Yersinia aldovae ATCC 35236]|nr:hypothetical protein yaldo0001_33930 [Yersinia aldovae ATCC 35236]
MNDIGVLFIRKTVSCCLNSFIASIFILLLLFADVYSGSIIFDINILAEAVLIKALIV